MPRDAARDGCDAAVGIQHWIAIVVEEWRCSAEFGKLPILFHGDDGILPPDVKPETFPDREADVGHNLKVVVEEFHVVGVGEEIGGIVKHFSGRLLYQTAVGETEADEKTAPGVAIMEQEWDIDIVEPEGEAVGVAGTVVSATLGKESLEAEVPGLVSVESCDSADATDIAPLAEALELVTLYLRQGETARDKAMNPLGMYRGGYQCQNQYYQSLPHYASS